ncbi:regulator of G-protein signaling 7-like, partial [Amphibalanus amphitrite]|uniref:regulator of G-protein signaling 7-like n=1 Tax=Amphibalanus amphitrite TaxID=1232801 RepID=UPI001C9223AB
METLVRRMQSADAGVPVRCQKLFLTTIPSAFMGYDLIEWLMENLPIDDSAEALHLASLLCQHGYFFPVGDAKTLQVKDDSSLYRFQTPYYWPSRNHVPDSTDYAIYLHKKIAKNKQKHGLEDCELVRDDELKKKHTF